MTSPGEGRAPVAMLTSMMEKGVTSDEYPIRTTGDAKSLCGDCTRVKRAQSSTVDRPASDRHKC